jgi:hypothetical protein
LRAGDRGAEVGVGRADLDDGRIVAVDVDPATQVPGFPAVKMEVSAPGCPQKTLKAVFVGIILELSEWVRKKPKPIRLLSDNRGAGATSRTQRGVELEGGIGMPFGRTVE